MNQIFEKIRKYNIWDGQSLQIGYERKNYLEKITEYIDTRLVKVLVGQRRVGKSYILRQIISFLTYLQTGGLPEMFHFNSEELNRNYSESLKNTVILRDIVGRHKIKDIQLLEDLFKFLAVNISNLTSISSIVNYFMSKQKKTKL